MNTQQVLTKPMIPPTPKKTFATTVCLHWNCSNWLFNIRTATLVHKTAKSHVNACKLQRINLHAVPQYNAMEWPLVVM